MAGHGQQGAPMLTVGKAALALERRTTGYRSLERGQSCGNELQGKDEN